MAKNKKASNEAKKKVPFNVLRKGAMTLALAGIMAVTPFALAGCAGEKGDMGPAGPAGATWYSGTQYSAEQGNVGDFFYDTDDYNIYQKTASGWTLISNIKGPQGNDGEDGEEGREIQIQATQDYIQWRYEGDANWQNLVSLSALKGADGEDATAPTVTIENGVWVINGVPTVHTAVATDGEEGNTPYIQDGYWYIDGVNQNIKAEGTDGQNGNNGKSAYEIAYELDNSIGTEAEWIASLQGQDGREVTFNVSPTHIQWKYTGEETWNDLISLESLKGLKGDPGDDGKSAYEIALENDPSIGSEAEWLASLKGEKGDPGEKGETGKGITNVEIVYEYDENGKLWAVFTITYSEGEPQVIRSAVPKRVTALNGITLGNNSSTMYKFAKVESAADAPTLYLNVQFDDDTSGDVLLTDDMFTVDEYNGFSIPDFTQVGTYNYQIKYMGKQTQSYVEIVDLANYITPVSNIYMINSTVTTSSKLSDLVVNITYQNGESVLAQLTDVAESYYSYETNQALTELDLTQVSSYEIALKSEFAFKYNEEDEEYATLYLSVYDESCTIQYIDVQDIQLALGDADFEEALKATAFEGYLYKANESGQQHISGTVEDLTYDLEGFDINRVGTHYIPFTYQLDGETGYYSNYFEVSVVADLSEAQAVGTYTVNAEDTDMMMFMMAQGDSVTLYDNGVAVVTNTQYGQESQASYDASLVESGVLKIYDSFMNDYAYFTLNGETNTVGFYTVDGETTPTDYTCQIEMMGEMYDATISIYGTEGTCKAKVSILMPAEVTGAPMDMYMAYAFVDCVWEDADTVSGIGRTFNVTTGNVLVEVTE